VVYAKCTHNIAKIDAHSQSVRQRAYGHTKAVRRQNSLTTSVVPSPFLCCAPDVRPINAAVQGGQQLDLIAPATAGAITGCLHLIKYSLTTAYHAARRSDRLQHWAGRSPTRYSRCRRCRWQTGADLLWQPAVAFPPERCCTGCSEHTRTRAVAHKRHGCELSPGAQSRVDRCVCISVAKPRCFSSMCW
jgi:hypothetical protein